MPLMVTGGIRRREVAERALQGPVAMIGMATALAVDPTLPRRWQAGERVQVEPIVVAWKNKAFAAVATQSVVKKQLTLLSEGRPTNPRTSPLLALIGNQLKLRRLSRRYRRWVAQA